MHCNFNQRFDDIDYCYYCAHCCVCLMILYLLFVIDDCVVTPLLCVVKKLIYVILFAYYTMLHVNNHCIGSDPTTPAISCHRSATYVEFSRHVMGADLGVLWTVRLPFSSAPHVNYGSFLTSRLITFRVYHIRYRFCAWLRSIELRYALFTRASSAASGSFVPHTFIPIAYSTAVIPPLAFFSFAVVIYILKTLPRKRHSSTHYVHCIPLLLWLLLFEVLGDE